MVYLPVWEIIHSLKLVDYLLLQMDKQWCKYHITCHPITVNAQPGPIEQWLVPPDSRAKGPGFDTQSSHILLFLLPLIKEGQLSVTSEVCARGSG